MAGKPGRSGRKPKAVQNARPIALAEKQIGDRLPLLIDKLFELAEGVTVQERDSTGKTRVYERPPDFKAASYLVDRVMGKPKQAVEASGPDGGALLIRVVYDDLSPDDADDPSSEAASWAEEDPA